MTRIIGGAAGGRRIKAPPGEATRPTTDRVREALFSALESRLGSLRGLRFLDLYAGSGAVALEAASRGAIFVTAVESDRRTARLVSDNARAVGLDVAVVGQPVARVLATPPEAPYDVFFLDPPYPLKDAQLAADLTALVDQGWVVEADGLVVVERATRSVEPLWPAGLGHVTSKTYGESTLWYVRRVPEGPTE
jgi:16S rRNA (guanine966-N2)-methyltransferase